MGFRFNYSGDQKIQSNVQYFLSAFKTETGNRHQIDFKE